MPMRLGIDLGGTKIEGIALDGSREVARRRVPAPRGDYAATMAAVVELVATLEEEAGTPGTVGVGIPGTVSARTGLVKNANSVWLIGQPLQADLEHTLGRTVRIANDANCFAISEATDGAAAGARTVFGVIIGTGTGAGIVVEGTLLEGQHGIAGEWGHNPMPWPVAGEQPGPPCYCGKSGCIETFLSGPGLVRDYLAGPLDGSRPAAADAGQDPRSGAGLSAEQIVMCAEDGDADAEAALVRYEQRMARALASIINVLDPDVIVLGGGLSNIARLYPNVPRWWTDFVFACGPGERVLTRLVPAAHGDASGVRGAAWLWNHV
jgi:fructokinase